MEKQNLIEYIPFVISKQQLTESTSSNGELNVVGTIQRADSKNQNGRIYPKAILESAVNEYNSSKIAKGNAIGELDHPDSSVVSLERGSHNIKKVWWEGNDLKAKIEILCKNNIDEGTPNGNILASYLRRGIPVGISSRGLGSVENINEDTVKVNDDLEFLCWDFVSEPSTQGAFMEQIKEGVTHKKTINKYKKVESIIDSILFSN